MIFDFISGLFSDTKETIQSVVTDPNKRNELFAKLAKLEMEVEKSVYMAELGVKTVPWVDALHKMGRQILNMAAFIFVGAAIYFGHEITQYEVLLIGGPNVVYQFMKGAGKK